MSSRQGNAADTSSLDADAVPARLPFPPSTPVFVQTSKRLQGVTLDLGDVLPAIIRDARELQAAAILCAAGTAKGFFFKGMMTISADRFFIEIIAYRPTPDDIAQSRNGSRQAATPVQPAAGLPAGSDRPVHRIYIPLADVSSISKDLPPSFGHEALGNPMCGPRVTIITPERVTVVYTTTPLAREQWFQFLEREAARKRIAAKRAELGGGGVMALLERGPPAGPTATTIDGTLSHIDRNLSGNGLSLTPSGRQQHQHQHAAASGAETAAALRRAAEMNSRDRRMVGALPDTMRRVDLDRTTLTNRDGLSFVVPGTYGATEEGLALDDAAGFAGAAAARRAADRALLEQSRLGSPFAKWRSTRDSPPSTPDRQSDEDDDANDADSPAERRRRSVQRIRELAQYALPPLALVEAAAPSDAHLEWRFPAARALWPQARPDQLERIRVQHTLRIPGRWAEDGQCDPRDSEDGRGLPIADAGGEEDPILVARRNLLEKGGRGTARVTTALELLSTKRRGTDPSSSRQARPPPPPANSDTAASSLLLPSDAADHSYEASPFPWIAFPWSGKQEAHMQLLWRLAKLQVDIDAAQQQKHVGLAQDMSAAEVPAFWAERYKQARTMVRDRAASLGDRLGVRRVGRGYHYEHHQHEATASKLNRLLDPATRSAA